MSEQRELARLDAVNAEIRDYPALSDEQLAQIALRGAEDTALFEMKVKAAVRELMARGRSGEEAFAFITAQREVLNAE